jgi:hypothetical protein
MIVLFKILARELDRGPGTWLRYRRLLRIMEYQQLDAIRETASRKIHVPEPAECRTDNRINLGATSLIPVITNVQQAQTLDPLFMQSSVLQKFLLQPSGVLLCSSFGERLHQGLSVSPNLQ